MEFAAAGSPVRIGRGGTRARQLCSTEDWFAALAYYPAGLIHPPHEHSAAQLSLLITGGFGDTFGGREDEAFGGSQVFRPAGDVHACRFGSYGALILSVHFRSGRAPDFLRAGRRRAGFLAVELHSLLGLQAADPHSVISDLIAAASHDEGELRYEAVPPRWLRLAVQQMIDEPTLEIGAVATSAGVHRTHFARAFQRHFGVSPTHFRLHCKSAVAMRRMVELSEPPALAAAGAGFADQAHWTRTLRAISGIAPGRLKTLLAA